MCVSPKTVKVDWQAAASRKQLLTAKGIVEHLPSSRKSLDIF